jgi:hypothetical protein
MQKFEKGALSFQSCWYTLAFSIDLEYMREAIGPALWAFTNSSTVSIGFVVRSDNLPFFTYLNGKISL